MIGLRGVGKTVLLDRLREDAEGAGFQTIRVEAPENRSLPAILAPQLRQTLLRLSRNEQAKDLAQRALRALVHPGSWCGGQVPVSMSFDSWRA